MALGGNLWRLGLPRLARQQVAQAVRIQRPAEQESLQFVALLVAQDMHLPFGLHPLGGDPQVQGVARLMMACTIERSRPVFSMLATKRLSILMLSKG